MSESVLLLVDFFNESNTMKITNLLKVNGYVDEIRQGHKDLLNLLSKILTTLEEIRDLLDLGMGDAEIRNGVTKL
jgi:hypothetical protein